MWKIRFTFAVTLFFAMLTLAGCTLENWPRLENDISRFQTLKAWETITRKLHIEGQGAVLTRLMIDWQADGRLTFFNLEFYLPGSEYTFRYRAWTGGWSPELRLSIDQKAVEEGEVLPAGPEVETVLSALDEYGLARLAEGMEGYVSLWVSPLHQTEEDFSRLADEVYLLKGQSREMLSGPVRVEEGVKITLTAMSGLGEEERQALPGPTLIYILNLAR
ncbi:MAG: hypothetical protein ACUVV0_10290 [Anaerolineae bacterium]